MILFMPLADGQYIPSKVLKSLAQQTVSFDIIPCVTWGLVNSNKDVIEREDVLKKLDGEMAGRNKAVEWVNLYLTEEFVGFQDRDIVHLANDNYEKCLLFLKEHLDYGAVVLPWESYPVINHLKMSAMILRTEVLKKISFRYGCREHPCENLAEDIEQLGYKHCILDSPIKLTQELCGESLKLDLR